MGEEKSQTVDGEANQISNIQQALQPLSHWKSGGDGVTIWESGFTLEELEPWQGLPAGGGVTNGGAVFRGPRS